MLKYICVAIACATLVDPSEEMATQKEAFSDVGEMQTDLSELQKKLGQDTAQFDARLKSGNFPPAPPGAEMSLLETGNVDPSEEMATQKEAFSDVGEMQTDLSELQKKLSQDTAQLDSRLKSGNFPPAPPGAEMSLLETGNVNGLSDSHTQRLEQVIASINQHTAALQQQQIGGSSLLEIGCKNGSSLVETGCKNGSSLLETGSPKSPFADIDAQLKRLADKTKSEIAKLHQETAAPMSLLQKSPGNSFADVSAKLKSIEDKTKAELAKLDAVAVPTSLIETELPQFHPKKFVPRLNYAEDHPVEKFHFKVEKQVADATVSRPDLDVYNHAEQVLSAEIKKAKRESSQFSDDPDADVATTIDSKEFETPYIHQSHSKKTHHGKYYDAEANSFLETSYDPVDPRVQKIAEEVNPMEPHRGPEHENGLSFKQEQMRNAAENESIDRKIDGNVKDMEQIRNNVQSNDKSFKMEEAQWEKEDDAVLAEGAVDEPDSFLETNAFVSKSHAAALKNIRAATAAAARNAANDDDDEPCIYKNGTACDDVASASQESEVPASLLQRFRQHMLSGVGDMSKTDVQALLKMSFLQESPVDDALQTTTTDDLDGQYEDANQGLKELMEKMKGTEDKFKGLATSFIQTDKKESPMDALIEKFHKREIEEAKKVKEQHAEDDRVHDEFAARKVAAEEAGADLAFTHHMVPESTLGSSSFAQLREAPAAGALDDPRIEEDLDREGREIHDLDEHFKEKISKFHEADRRKTNEMVSSDDDDFAPAGGRSSFLEEEPDSGFMTVFKKLEAEEASKKRKAATEATLGAAQHFDVGTPAVASSSWLERKDDTLRKH